MKRKLDGAHRLMINYLVGSTIFLIAICMSGESVASTCLSGNCHTDISAKKYLHGPVAAEKAGAKGCVACHVPTGKGCAKGKKGTFKPLAKPIEMCQVCHSMGTGTQHSNQKIDCLKCHDPHGSDKNQELTR